MVIGNRSDCATCLAGRQACRFRFDAVDVIGVRRKIGNGDGVRGGERTAKCRERAKINIVAVFYLGIGRDVGESRDRNF